MQFLFYLSYLFRMLELPHEAIIILSCDALGVASNSFDVGLEWPLQELVHFAVVVIIVPDSEHTVDVMPDGATEWSGVHVLGITHSVEGQEKVIYLTLLQVQCWHVANFPGVLTLAQGPSYRATDILLLRKSYQLIPFGCIGGKRPFSIPGFQPTQLSSLLDSTQLMLSKITQNTHV